MALVNGITKVDERIVTSNTTKLDFDIIDSTNPYLFVFDDVEPNADDKYMYVRLRSGGTDYSSTNYVYHYLRTRSDQSSPIGNGRDSYSLWNLQEVGYYDGSQRGAYRFYIHGAQTSGKFTYITSESSGSYYSNWNFGNWVNGHVANAGQFNGITVGFVGGSIDNGIFKAYKIGT